MNELASLPPFDQLLEIDRRGRSRDLPSSTDLASPQGMAGGLALRLGAWRLVFPLEKVSELIPVPRITRVPGVKSWLLGIANLRGTVIPVIDLGVFLGGPTTVPTASSRVAVVRAVDFFYGFLIDEIIGLRHFGSESRLPNLDAIEARLRDYLSGGYRSEDRLWLMFDPGLVLNDARFLDAAAG